MKRKRFSSSLYSRKTNKDVLELYRVKKVNSRKKLSFDDFRMKQANSQIRRNGLRYVELLLESTTEFCHGDVSYGSWVAWELYQLVHKNGSRTLGEYRRDLKKRLGLYKQADLENYQFDDEELLMRCIEQSQKFSKWVKEHVNQDIHKKKRIFGTQLLFQPSGKLISEMLDSFKKECQERKERIRQEEDLAKEDDQNKKFNLSWLRKECVSRYQDRGSDIFDHIKNAITTEKNPTKLQNDLFGIVGVEGIDFLEQIITNKASLIQNALSSELDGTQKKSQQGFSFVSERQQDLEKRIKKQQSRVEKLNLKKGRLSRQERKEIGILTTLKKNMEVQRPPPSSIAGRKYRVIEILAKYNPEVFKDVDLDDSPELSRISGAGYEEYIVPAPPKLEDQPLLVPISTMPKWAQLAFKGYENLNRVQSLVYPIGFHTDENLLVSAPTGCGKTNVAMITVLREVGKHFKQGYLQKDEFKIVYVAPMKALAAEMTATFKKRLSSLGVQVREYTGDMQLSKRELNATQIIVTTPEKWDVVTRKATDENLLKVLKLLIFDEVHLLNEDRGPVIEVIVARTFRQVEQTQSLIRLVGLSATLPNYLDVADFLRVNPDKGLFYFDGRYRPVPLQQHYVGIIGKDYRSSSRIYDQLTFEKVEKSLREGNQVMVFVHSRKGTVMAGKDLVNKFRETQKVSLLQVAKDKKDFKLTNQVKKSSNKELKELHHYGIGFHHAGMRRQDRTLVERLFSEGQLNVLCCTSTLAWGVNLPAHTVIIKGTEIYDAKQGKIVHVGMLDVMQIFGRAGRPQFDSSGEGIIMTAATELPKYMASLTRATPIESQLSENLANHLNAEIVLGTVTNVREGVRWLTYTYLYVRMLKNPMAYGIRYDDLLNDPLLGAVRRNLITKAGKLLDDCKMIRFDESAETFHPTDIGRVASHFYIHYNTISQWNKLFKPGLTETQVLSMISQATEFSNLKLRNEEVNELTNLASDSHTCPLPVKDFTETSGKVNILIQAYISASRIQNFSLISDCAYVTQNVGRIARALFELAVRRRYANLADTLLLLNKCIENKMWAFQCPFRQFSGFPMTIIQRLEERNLTVDELLQLEPKEISEMIRLGGTGYQVVEYLHYIPHFKLETKVQPMTRKVLRVVLKIEKDFQWKKSIHGDAMPFWIWVEDPKGHFLYYSEYIMIKADEDNIPAINFSIPLPDPIPSQYFVRLVSDRWIGIQTETSIDLRDLILPEEFPPYTELLPLQPLPVTCLKNSKFESLYPFQHFNPVQTQVFHTCYHTDNNLLIGAPTGSGKTIVAELAVMRLWNENPGRKVVYIAPLKALVRERLLSWSKSFGKKLNKKVVQLTGDFTPDVKALKEADIVITTPEKWDGISRNWQKRNYVQQVGLIIIDEIHLLGSDRGSILEVIVSRMRYIGFQTQNKVRLVGLSTSIANSTDMAEWLGISGTGLYNFKPNVRPVQLQVHIQGFSTKHYCPRMKTMNKPVYRAIENHAQGKPTLIFVSSRRQTRLTAFDLIGFCAAADSPYRFVRMTEYELQEVCSKLKDQHLKHVLTYGIGMHHAGLCNEDKSIVETLFQTNKIQILICTSTLAWGVNFPAHLVILKGTKYFDPKTKRYENYPLVDVLQMMGRAGRPQYDNYGKAVIMCVEELKDYYKMFLYEPFPVESCLKEFLHDHINAEIVSGTIKSFQDAIDYLTWTYLFRRMIQNPSFYGVEGQSYDELSKSLCKVVEETIEELENHGAVQILPNIIKGQSSLLSATRNGIIASYYYMSYKSIHRFEKNITLDANCLQLLQYICESEEFSELPVRHNEEILNEQLSKVLPHGSFSKNFDSPSVKAYLLLQARISQSELPIPDYVTDTKSIMDQIIRVIQAFLDVSAEKGFASVCIRLLQINQMIMQAQWLHESSLRILPHVNDDIISHWKKKFGIDSITQLVRKSESQQASLLSKSHTSKRADKIIHVLKKLPNIKVKNITLSDVKESSHFSCTIMDSSANHSEAYLPKYSKTKAENWYLLLCDGEQLLKLKRIHMNSKKQVVNVTLTKKVQVLKIHLISDCYIGFDREFDASFIRR